MRQEQLSHGRVVPRGAVTWKDPGSDDGTQARLPVTTHTRVRQREVGGTNRKLTR